MSVTTSKPSKAAALAAVRALIAGTEKRFPSAQFTLGNTAYTTTSLVQLLQSLVAAIESVNAAQASARDAVAALRDLEAKVLPVIGDFKRFLLTTFGSATQILADFGLEPRKARTPMTTEEKAAAAAKRRATRQARGTTSKKQKLAVKGNVTGVTITPVTAPAPASPSAQPAPGASSVSHADTPSK